MKSELCDKIFVFFVGIKNEFMSENISEIVRNKIERTDYGIVFSASDFPVEVTKLEISKQGFGKLD